MKTTAQRLRTAETELQRRRTVAEEGARRRRVHACQKIPDLARLLQQIAESGAAVAKLIGGSAKDQDHRPFLEFISKQNLAAQTEQAQLLRVHGLSETYLSPDFTCPLCRDTGFVRGTRCECFHTLLREISSKELCMDAPLETSTFELFSLDYYTGTDPKSGKQNREIMSKILQYCQNYAKAFTPHAANLLCYGPTGLGKTHLSLAIAQCAINLGNIVIYASAQTLLNRLEREHFKRYGEGTGEVEEMILDCDLLILDDLGTEFSTSFTKSTIYHIINTRLARRNSMIINTNLNEQEREDAYGQRITSRMIGNFIPLRFVGSDVRQVKCG